MSYRSFMTILGMVWPALEQDERMANLHGGPIIPEMCLLIAIRFLAGASYLDMLMICGISKPSFYRVFHPKSLHQTLACTPLGPSRQNTTKIHLAS